MNVQSDKLTLFLLANKTLEIISLQLLRWNQVSTNQNIDKSILTLVNTHSYQMNILL